MNNIDRRINKKEYTLRIADELGFDSYSEALREYHDYGLKADDIGHLFNKSSQTVENHAKALGLTFN